MLAYLMAEFFNKEKPESKITKNSVEWIDNALKSYALCNLYRCAFVPSNDINKIKGLYHSCEIMQKKIFNEFECQEPFGVDKRARLVKGIIKNKQCIFVQTLHGGYGGFKSHEYLQYKLNPILNKTIEMYKSSI